MSNNNTYSEELEKINARFLEIRKEAKSDLIKEIGALFIKDDARNVTSYGAVGRLHDKDLTGIFYVNYDRNLEPCQATGTGRNDLELYQWIPLKYKEGDEEYNYCLELCCSDLDMDTGEIHVNFSKLQMHKIIYSDGEEIGGQNVKEGELEETEDHLGYYLPYRCYLSFPAAVRGDVDKKKRKTKQGSALVRTIKEDQPEDEYKYIYAPWDYEDFKKPAPVMNLADDNYDLKKVAKFFIELVKHDIRSNRKRGVA